MADSAKPFFVTRGVVVLTQDIRTGNWVDMAKQAQLTTIATHIAPAEVVRFLKTEEGCAFVEKCRELRMMIGTKISSASSSRAGRNAYPPFPLPIHKILSFSICAICRSKGGAGGTALSTAHCTPSAALRLKSLSRERQGSRHGRNADTLQVSRTQGHQLPMSHSRTPRG